MNYICFLGLVSVALASYVTGAEITQGQQVIYPHNPHLVKSAGNAFDDPKAREQFINAMKKASNYVRKAAWGCGAAALGCLVALVRAETMKRRAASLAMSLLFAAGAIFLDKVSTVQAQMALSQEVAVIPRSGDAAPTVKLVGVAEGVHIFSTANCPPCKLLHKALDRVREAFPALEIFEYEINSGNSAAQEAIQRMGISVLSTPLTVVVKNGVIARIVVGYSSVNDFLQKLTESLK
jgi:glutaredoxin